MEISTHVFFQKTSLAVNPEDSRFHQGFLHRFLLLLCCILSVGSSIAQSGTIRFSQADYLTDEAAGTVTLELQRVGGSVGEITADILTHDGTATINDDYAGIPSPLTLTWSDGNTSPKTVTLPIKPDTVIEGNETFTMDIVSDHAGMPRIATVTIQNTPNGTIQFSRADYLTDESAGTVTLELQRVGGSVGEITAIIQTHDGTATINDDYAGIPSPLTLTWSDGNTTPKTVTIPIKPDTVAEGDETFTMDIVSDHAGTPSTATVTIANTPNGTIQFSQADYLTDEAAGTVTLELQRVGGSVGEITADIQTHDGTATINDDYAGIPSPLTLSWSDGNTTPKTVTLPIKPDTVAEGDETFTMDIVSDHAGTPSTATVTIANTPNGTIQFSQANYLTDEAAGTVTLELQRVGGSVGAITATIQTHDGTATIVDDYAGIPSPLTLTWSDGNTSPKTVTLPIKPDAIEEPDETFTMDIVSDHAGTPSIATVTIANTPNGKIQFSQANYFTDEATGTVTLELQRVGGSVGEITADIQTHDGTATIVDDYAGIPSPLTLTWSDGNTSPKTVTLPIKPDAIEEPDETFTMDIVSDHAGTPSIATVTIANTPNGKIQFSQANYLTDEAAGTVTLELQRVGGSVGEITAAIQTHDGTATIVDDYSGIPSPLTLTWSDGNTSPKTVTLPIKADVIEEPDETFTMDIVSDHAGTPNVATVTIIGEKTCEIPATADAGADQIACGDRAVAIVATSSGAGIWSGGTGSFADASMTSTTYTPANSELGTTVTLTWTTLDSDGSGPCTTANGSMDITFDEEPNAGVGSSTAVCEGTIVDLLTLVSVPGGTFSGPGVSGTTFDTTGLPFGNYQITYSVSSGNSCPDDTAIITVTVKDDTVSQSCDVLDIDFCDPGEAPFYNFYWNEMKLVVPGSEFFSQNATHALTYTEFTDGTALIQGTTQSGTCSAELYIVLKDEKNWTAWNASGGDFKPQGCNPGVLVKENLRYYIVDGSKSTITTTGGDCLEEGTFKVTQRPDPADLSTPNLGVHVGPGGALFDSDTNAEGLAGWAWMGPNGDERRWQIDFNFHIKCKENTDCKPEEEVCDGIDNDGDGEIDEGFDADGDGIPDCEDTEECDGVDNDGDDLVDEGFDSDDDGTPDCEDTEVCDGLDNDGDGEIDEGFDSDDDGTPDCDDEEVCDGLDNDGDGEIDEGFDSDDDGTTDCDDEEVCDGLDNDGDGEIDEGFDSDDDGTPDCDDEEVCDGMDNDGDGEIDEGFDSDDDGTPDCDDEEVCDGLDNDGDGEIDEGFDSDDDGTPDCDDEEVCDGLDNDGDGEIDEVFDSDDDGTPDCDDEEVCDGLDNDGDGEIDEGFDSDDDGTPDCDDVEECDGLDNDGDGEIDEGFDSDDDGTPDCDDEEVCDGLDNDGDGEIDEGFDSDDDGTPDCDDEEVCDGLDNDGDGEIDEGFDSDDDGTPDCDDVEECDGLDNDGDGEIDEGFDSDDDGTPDCDDEEVCDGLDNDGDGEIDEGFDSDDDGTPDCDDEEVCDGLDNDGDGEIDEGLDCEDTLPSGCETAFGRLENNNTCFIDDGFNRWGWTNFLATTGDYTMDLYSGAGQCIISADRKTGEVIVNYDSESVTVTVDMFQGFSMKEAHLYVGSVPYPEKGNNNTVAPGQYPYNSGDLDDVSNYTFGPIDISDLDAGIYIILHAVTCEIAADKTPVATSVKTYHRPYENNMILDLEIPYDATIDVQFMDMSGRQVMKKRVGNVTSGKNMLQLKIHDLATEVHIMRIDTGREVIQRKVYFLK